MSDNEIYLKEINEQGRTLFSCDKYGAAIKQYEKALEVDPMYLPTYFNMCEACIMNDNYEMAKKMMKRVLMVEKNNGEAYFHLGNVALLENNYDEGKLQYAKAINNGYDSPQIYLNLAAVAEDNDEWGEALSNYSKAITRDRRCYTAKIRKIQIYMMLKEFTNALNEADDLIDTNPEIFEGHHFKFVILGMNNRFSEAEEVLDKAQALFPDDQGFVLDRVKLYELKGDFSNALKLLEGISTGGIREDVLVAEKAQIFISMQQFDDSLCVLEAYTGEVVSEIEKMKIVIYMGKADYENIRKCADKIVQLAEHDANYFAALYYRAYALKMLGDSSKAEQAYLETAKILQQACSINSGLLDLYIYRAICYRELKKYDMANEMLDYVELVYEDLAETHYVRYLVYLDTNDERASTEFDKAKSLNKEIAGLFGE